MSFNLNISRKKEYGLQERQIDELISMYGIKCKYLYTEKQNIDLTVFKDFSHLELGSDFKDVYLLPENSENWDDSVTFNLFGAFNQWSQNLFISKKSILELFPDFFERGRKDLINSLIVTPGSSVLEITNAEPYNIGLNNMWSYADQPSSYKLTVRIYDHNIADRDISNLKTSIKLEESSETQTIFEQTEDIDTSDIDAFFNSLEVNKSLVEEESFNGRDGSKTGTNDTNSPFGNLS